MVPKNLMMKSEPLKLAESSSRGSGGIGVAPSVRAGLGIQDSPKPRQGRHRLNLCRPWWGRRILWNRGSRADAPGGKSPFCDLFAANALRRIFALAMFHFLSIPSIADELEFVGQIGGSWGDCVIEGDRAYLVEGNFISAL